MSSAQQINYYMNSTDPHVEKTITIEEAEKLLGKKIRR